MLAPPDSWDSAVRCPTILNSGAGLPSFLRTSRSGRPRSGLYTSCLVLCAAAGFGFAPARAPPLADRSEIQSRPDAAWLAPQFPRHLPAIVSLCSPGRPLRRQTPAWGAFAAALPPEDPPPSTSTLPLALFGLPPPWRVPSLLGLSPNSQCPSSRSRLTPPALPPSLQPRPAGLATSL